MIAALTTIGGIASALLAIFFFLAFVIEYVWTPTRFGTFRSVILDIFVTSVTILFFSLIAFLLL